MKKWPMPHEPKLRGFFSDVFGFTRRELKKFKLVDSNRGGMIIGYRDKFVYVDIDDLPDGLRFCVIGCSDNECNACQQMRDDWSYVLSKDLHQHYDVDVPELCDPEYFNKLKHIIINWLNTYTA